MGYDPEKDKVGIPVIQPRPCSAKLNFSSARACSRHPFFFRVIQCAAGAALVAGHSLSMHLDAGRPDPFRRGDLARRRYNRVMRLIELKAELQSCGARTAGLLSREGGAGPSDGTTLFIGDMVVNVPALGGFATRSRFSIEESGGEFMLFNRGSEVIRVEPAGEPGFYSLETPGGVSFRKLALRHGRDAIGTTVVQTCAHGSDACSFCSIDSSAAAGATVVEKNPEELGRVAAAAEEEGYRHVVLTTGTARSAGKGIEKLARCASAVRQTTSMKLHVQFEPPGDPAWIEEAGRSADSCAINIESFDPEVRSSMTPGKAKTPADDYVVAWKKAVDVFGPGNVTCFIVVGLGEEDTSVEEGVRLLASLGVYPFLLPLRPLTGSRLQDIEPPQADRMMRLYESCAVPVIEAGLKARDCQAGCVRCSACSAFPDLTG
jgi:radical SAM protein (TIGR04043 family)